MKKEPFIYILSAKRKQRPKNELSWFEAVYYLTAMAAITWLAIKSIC